MSNKEITRTANRPNFPVKEAIGGIALAAVVGGVGVWGIGEANKDSERVQQTENNIVSLVENGQGGEQVYNDNGSKVTIGQIHGESVTVDPDFLRAQPNRESSANVVSGDEHPFGSGPVVFENPVVVTDPLNAENAPFLGAQIDGEWYWTGGQELDNGNSPLAEAYSIDGIQADTATVHPQN